MIRTRLLRMLYRAYPFQKGRGRFRDFIRRRLTGKFLYREAPHAGGNLLMLDLDNLIDCMTYMDGPYEAAEIAGLEAIARARRCDCFIDVGANIGSYSLHFVRDAAYLDLWAFEPDPRNFAQLSANLWLNDAAQRVRSLPFALSTEPGSATFFVNKPERAAGGPQFNTGTSSLVRDTPHHRPITVETARLDAIVRLQNRRILIKIDVEGAECAVLEGGRGLLLDNDCVLMVEIWDHPPERAERVRMLLAGYGYEAKAADLGAENFLFVRAQSGTASAAANTAAPAPAEAS